MFNAKEERRNVAGQIMKSSRSAKDIAMCSTTDSALGGDHGPHLGPRQGVSSGEQDGCDGLIPDCKSDYGLLSTAKAKGNYTYIKRKRSTREEGKYRKRRLVQLEQKDTSEMQSWPCCQKLRCFRTVNTELFEHHRKKLMGATQTERKLALSDMLQTDGRFYFDKRPVCTFFLMTAFGFSKDLQRTVKGTPKAPATSSVHRNQSKYDKQNGQRDLIIAFLREFASATADKMPGSDEQHLPLYRKKLVYEEFLKDFQSSNVEGHEKTIPSYSYFVSIWNRHLPKITVRRKVPPVAKCTECTMIHIAMEKASKDPKASEELAKRRKNHSMFITFERVGYMSRTNLAARSPDEVCSIAIKGADQQSFGLPHFSIRPRDKKGEAIRVKLVRIMEHAPTPILTIYTLTDEYKTGANHIIEAIHRWMNYRRQMSPLPGKLFIQADSCSREGKNRYLLGYVESLVAWGVFEEVQVSFWPVGHAHSSVDQKLSCITSWLKDHSAITLRDLHAELRKSYNPVPFVQSMRRIANISQLMDMENVFTTLPTFSEFLYFRFTRSGQSVQNNATQYSVQCSVKKKCQDNWRDNWRPLFPERPNSGFLRVTPNLQNTPDTVITSPYDFAEVEKRIVSEEPRINDPSKMAELRELQQAIYKSRRESFHWDLSNCLEGKGMTEALERESADQPTVFDDGPCMAQTRLEHDIHSFVIVRPHHSTRECPFWVGRIENLSRNRNGDVSDLRVWWYEVGEGECVLKGHYKPSVHPVAKKNHLPWITDVPSDSVLLNFERLNNDNTLGADISYRLELKLQALDVDLRSSASPEG